MQLNSTTFVCFFACLFLLYYILPQRAQKPLLLIGSLAFYAVSGWRNLALILSMTAIAYVCTGSIARAARRKEQQLAQLSDADAAQKKECAHRCRCAQKRTMALGVALLLLGLSFFKFGPGIAGTLHTLPRLSSLVFPMGMSFFTFQLVGYVVDVYRGRTQHEASFFRLCLFSCYFPQLVQGPISRYGELSATLYSPVRFDGAAVGAGLVRVLWGYLKKLVIADTVMIAVAVIAAAPQDYPGGGVWLLLILYTVQIYGDFTGGMDIAIGCSEMLGIRLRENFLHPFASATVGEYWRRWHITMSAFFTDYVFYPLSLSGAAQWLSKRLRRVLGARWATQVTLWLATLLTWLLTGLWHGAGWNFAVWGLLNGVAMIAGELIFRVMQPFKTKHPRFFAGRLCHLGCCVRTFLIVGLLRTLDVYRNVSLAFSLWGSLFDVRAYAALGQADFWTSLALSAGQWGLLAAGVLAMYAVGQLTLEPGEAAAAKWSGTAQGAPRWGVKAREALLRRPVLFAVVLAMMVAIVLIFGRYGYGYDATDFIYNQF